MKSDLFILPTLPYGVQESRKTNADEKRRKTHMQLNRSMTRDVSEEILLPFPEDSTTKRALLILCPGRAVSGVPPCLRPSRGASGRRHERESSGTAEI